jgi:hypothetical protein
MKKRFTAIIILATLTVSATAQQWPEMRQEAKTGARWWWLGSAVNKENLRWTMQEYANHGIGALEITPIYGVQGNQTNNIPYLSDQWMEMLRFTQEQGRANGIEIDMATGTGWPFGGPWVPMEESANKAIFVNSSFVGKSVSDLKKLVSVVLLKDLIFPLTAILLAWLLKAADSVEYAILVSVFASPTAVASAIMASEMGGDRDLANEIVAYVGDMPVTCLIGGTLRGILPDGIRVHEGMKSGDVDPRCQPDHCRCASDKALSVGGGVLEALLHFGYRE